MAARMRGWALQLPSLSPSIPWPRGNGNNGQGNGRGDPLIQSFEGTLFFFHGEPGGFYNLASIKDIFQVTTQLKEANNAAHIGSSKNGTYMQSIGFMQEDARIVVETFADDSSRMTVRINDEGLPLEDLTVVHPIQLKSGGIMTVVFTLFMSQEGTVLSITSPLINLAVSLVPPGLDHAGYWQPSYLNVNLTLLAPPQGTLTGVIGDTYHYKSDSLTAATADTPTEDLAIAHYTDMVYPVFPDIAYELPSLFDTPRYNFPSTFIHDVIQQRKARAARFVTPTTLPETMVA